MSRLLISKVNTIPGFTDISMDAKAITASVVAYAALVDRLVAHGLARVERAASSPSSG